MYSYIYLDEDTSFHRLDPRVKILITFTHYLIVMIWVRQIYLLLAVLAECIILAILTKSWRNLGRVKFVFVAIFITGEIGWLLMAKGETTLFGPITLEPILMGLSTVLRSTIGIIISIILLTTTRNEELSQAMIKFGLPYRIGFAFSATLRMAPTLIGMTTTVRDAQRSRGLDLESGSFLQRIRKFIPLVAPAFLLTMRGTDQFAMAIESKGFGYQKERGNYIQLNMTSSDYVWTAICIGLTIFAITISVTGLWVVFTLQ